MTTLTLIDGEQLPIRGIDPMTSNEFIALWEEGIPRYPTRTFPAED